MTPTDILIADTLINEPETTPMQTRDGEKIIALIRDLANILEETAREAGADGLPSGYAYAAFNAYGVNLEVFNAIVSTMEAAGRITVRQDCIYAKGL